MPLEAGQAEAKVPVKGWHPLIFMYGQTDGVVVAEGTVELGVWETMVLNVDATLDMASLELDCA
jgi:hypothetical protein